MIVLNQWYRANCTIVVNSEVIPVFRARFKMAPTPYVFPWPLNAIRYLPPAISHSMVSYAIGYRTHRQEVLDRDLWLKLYQHRGIMIRDLSEKISKCGQMKQITTQNQKNMADLTIACIVVFLSTEV